MKINVDFLDGQMLQATFGQFSLTSDQSVAAGGTASHPEPFDYFAASMPLCAAFYIRKFCEQRNISTEGIEVSQQIVSSEEDKYKKYVTIEIKVPDTFPEKYKKAVIAAANSCTVKKVIQAQPEFTVNVVS